MSMQIYRVPQEFGSHLRLFIEGDLYNLSFTNMRDMKEWFRTRPRHLGGNVLDDNTIIYDTEIVRTYGVQKTHFVIKQFDRATPFFVIGASPYMHNHRFEEAEDAFDFAAAKAKEYDAI
ncbi:hypothetical protein DSM25558_1977 [Agrobacterium sp. DSM 25558]|uniref:hypothetical protein n=1 Tax=Agrobacterium sp. DSM 25558 TaxID=1907665 RepID=UPI0009725278|nr:hypothetical protein [Agrobacterium sp. DSM 25558]SCX15442.1 hypothetical protein DSM25558_1977 [Agrobacterium sp. DSM 25558]